MAENDLAQKLQKQAINDLANKQTRIKELVAILDKPEGGDDLPPAWTELKSLILPEENKEEPKLEEEPAAEDTKVELTEEEQYEVKKLVDGKTRSELNELAEELEIKEPEQFGNKEEVAEAIVRTQSKTPVKRD